MPFRSERGAWLKAQRVVSSPVYATVTTVLAVITGLLGSVYQNDIAAAFPMVWSGPWGQISGRAVVFWVGVVIFAVLFFFRQWWDDMSRERLADTAARAEEGTARIKDLVRTMPPRAFQTQLAQMVGGAHRGLAKMLPRSRREEISPDSLAAFIRSLLNSVARLALIYDDQPLGAAGPVVYSTNVMLWVPRPEGPWPEGIRKRLRFCADDIDLGQLLGVLELRPDLSATSQVAELPPPDDDILAMALPVPQDAKRDGRWQVLPGAPKAFLTERVDGYDNAATLAEWCSQNGDFRPSVIDELRLYFSDGAGRGVGSFISRPLLTLDGERLGVLNLHSNQPDILGDFDERMPAFQAMLTPIFLELEAAIEVLIKAEAAGRSIATRST